MNLPPDTAMYWMGSLITEQQDASGLLYRRNRYYDPASGKFTQPDPIGINGGLNTYGFANGDPINASDPFGLCVFGLPCPQGFVDAVAGFGDGASFGLSGVIRRHTFGGDGVNYGSGAYAGGMIAGVAASAVVDGGLAAADGTAAVSGSAVEIGEYAGESIPARSAARDFTAGERAEIDRIGLETGCHTCGTRTAGTKSGHFVPDHQPANALNPDGNPQRLYPQCLACSRNQGLEIARRLKSGGGE